MLIKDLIDEDFTNYKKPCMYIAASKCNWKCCIEQGLDVSVCQNSQIARQNDFSVTIPELYDRYINNPITESILFSGLEPMLQFEDVLETVKYFRNNGCNDDFVIYTGYYKEEILDKVEKLSKYKNIVIKFGRYKPDSEKHKDKILGVELISNNQYAERIS